MTRRGKSIGYGVILLWMFLPFIPVIIAAVIASACGCDLDEGDVHSCIVFGKDIGGVLYTMGMMGWLGVCTFLTGIPALVVFSVIVWWQKRAVSQE